MVAELALGTAQFGLNYGITNSNGIIDEKESSKILDLACKAGLNFIDTAQNYGLAEEILGKVLPKKSKFKIISKISSQKVKDTNLNLDNLEKNFFLTLKKLNINRLDSLLLHDSSLLLLPNRKELINWLISLKKRSFVKRIGVSIYNFAEIKYLPIDLLDIVQLPLSIYDQRLINNGSIDYLENKGISIHARSIFLQGLILQESHLWPEFLTDEFNSHHKNFIKHTEDINSTLLNEALNFALNIKNIEAVVVGVSSFNDFKNILNSYNLIKKGKKDNLPNYSKYSWENINDLDPRLWKK